VTYLRYYRSPQETGIHTLKLWSITGTLLASVSVNFGPDIIARWEQGQLNTPVAVQGGVDFVVTVTTSAQQSKTPCGLSPAINNGPLSAHGGRWIQGDGIFPTTNSCGNFWTDVYFDQ
jgi:Domain of unknown function (DUF4082)